jgi:hypothetical protein
VSTFSGLSDISSPSFGQEVRMLETLAKYRSCVVMLDLECDDLVNEMFSTFFAVARLVYHEIFCLVNYMCVLMLKIYIIPLKNSAFKVAILVFWWCTWYFYTPFLE